MFFTIFIRTECSYNLKNYCKFDQQFGIDVYKPKYCIAILCEIFACIIFQEEIDILYILF